MSLYEAMQCLPPRPELIAVDYCDHHSDAMARRRSSLPIALGAAAIMGFAGVYGFSDGSLSLDSVAAVTSGSCNIKGNVSIDSGERIYHVPGQRYYVETNIDPRRGERWFCSEADARAAGWRRSRV